MKQLHTLLKELTGFLILWITQSGSALIVWSYEQQGSALTTALLSVCSYTPYVLMSIFAGALSDKWNKKITMLASDSFAALCTVTVLVLLKTDRLEIWHLYCLNALNGLMNTIQQPVSDVAISLLTSRKHDQKVSGMRSLSNSLVSIMTPVIAAAMLAFAGLDAVIAFDLVTFVIAFAALLFFVQIPEIQGESEEKEGVLQAAKAGLSYLKDNRGILDLILFLAAINFTASIYNAAFPAMILSREGGGEVALGMVNAVTGIAMLTGSVLATVLPAPRSRVRVICNTLLISMSTNMDVLFRKHIPIAMQGRVFSPRNTLQFFTIPLGYFVGGVLVDLVFEPFMAVQPAKSLLVTVFS